ncbi:hypothetical protein [Mycobacteroides sp. PCS013]|uniref:hypothetical protein n=1 Tax=Mycobacteroides sp. PCS013 TaxID=3074106 RepID=UPI003C2EE62C
MARMKVRSLAMALPTKVWSKYELDIRNLGENRGGVDASDGFLESLDLVDASSGLTVRGQALFWYLFAAPDAEAASSTMHSALLQNPECLAICQSLYGVPRAQKRNAESVLRAQRHDAGLTDRNLGTLLTILSDYEIISYKRGLIEVLNPVISEGFVPPSVFISRDTPYSNIMWMTRVLRECAGHIYWMDKHFQPAALDMIADVADGNRVKAIHVLSLRLEGNSSAKTRRRYEALKHELEQKGVALEWRFIDSQLVKATHDRWVIGQDSARNVPDVGTVLSGNHSELSRSDQASVLNPIFERYWVQAVEFQA